MQIILINGLVFIAWLLIKTALVRAGYKAYYQALYQFLRLPAAWGLVQASYEKKSNL